MKMKATSFLWLVFCLTQTLIAQQGVVSLGGDIVSSNGSVAFSIGQIAFESVTGEAGSVNQGIQQPFQFEVVLSDEIDRDYFLKLYPNPSDRFLCIHLSPDESIIRSKDFFAYIYDMKGNLLISQKLNDVVNTILINELPQAVYFVQVWQANSFIQSISFSKTN
jgi:hypothetical protein